MKYLYTMIMMLLCNVALHAEQLTPAQALARLKGTPLSSSIHKVAPVTSGLQPVYTSKGPKHVYYYVFEINGMGSVFVGADDMAPAMLGYVEGGAVDMTKLPDGLKYWLAEYERQIEASIEKQIPMYTSADNSGNKSNIPYMVTALWGQGGGSDPANIKCPQVDGQYCFTGCVATAMAQVMYYHKYPEHGIGSHSYSWNETVLSANFGQTTYQWEQMIDAYGDYSIDGNTSHMQYASYTGSQANALATLMYHCGVGVEMEYTTSGSGALPTNEVKALRDYFGYDKGLSLEFRSYYKDKDWENMVYGELAAGRPILYSGYHYYPEGGVPSGHAFVCDGYKDGFYHINWGWNGMANGYFAITGTEALQPGYQGTGGAVNLGDNFADDQMAIIGVQPDCGGVIPTKMRFKGVVLYSVVNANNTICSEFKVGDKLGIVNPGNGATSRGMFVNFGDADITVDLGTIFENTMTGEMFGCYDELYQNISIPENYGMYTIMSVVSSMPTGNYYVYPAFRDQTTGNKWRKMYMDNTLEAPVVHVVGEDVSTDADVNGDGVTNAKDIADIKAYILGKTTSAGFDAAKADLNSDGYVDVLDLQILQYEVNKSGTPLPDDEWNDGEVGTPKSSSLNVDDIQPVNINSIINK